MQIALLLLPLCKVVIHGYEFAICVLPYKEDVSGSGIALGYMGDMTTAPYNWFQGITGSLMREHCIWFVTEYLLYDLVCKYTNHSLAF